MRKAPPDGLSNSEASRRSRRDSWFDKLTMKAEAGVSVWSWRSLSLPSDCSLQEVPHLHNGVLCGFLAVFDTMSVSRYATRGSKRQVQQIKVVMRSGIND